MDGSNEYSPPTVVIAEGARIGIVTCLRCGAAVLVDPRDRPEDSGQTQHNLWHERFAQIEGGAYR